MTKQPPITPPPELVQQWIRDWTKMVHQWALIKDDKDLEKPLGPSEYTAIQAARWGADQELEACCEWFQEFYKTESWVKHDLKHFRKARRPKPPSLKEQALALINHDPENQPFLSKEGIATIRRAIDALPDD